MNPVELVLHKGPIFSNVMFVEKIGSVGRWFVLLVWGGESLVSTRLAMSSSWISVMQAAVDDLLLMTQILFVVGRSSIDYIFFSLYLVLFWIYFPFCSELYMQSVLISWALNLAIYQNRPISTKKVLMPFYVISLPLTYIKLCYLLVVQVTNGY